MADEKKPSSVATLGNDFVDAAGVVGTSLARAGALALSWPFYILPTKDRDEAITATTQIFITVGELHLSVLRAAALGLSRAAREFTKPVDVGTTPTVTKSSTKVPIETAPATKR